MGGSTEVTRPENLFEMEPFGAERHGPWASCRPKVRQIRRRRAGGHLPSTCPANVSGQAPGVSGRDG